MRDKLQALLKKIEHEQWITASAAAYDICGELKTSIESILATEPPAVTVRAGWVCKDMYGLWWCSQMPVWGGYGDWYRSDPDSRIEDAGDVITDPWAESHPNGGSECCMEVK